MIKFQNSHGGNLEMTWPEKKCPVCGNGFYPHPGQPWGCAHKDTKGHEVKLCSIPCMRAYEQIDLKRRAMKAAKLLSVKAWLMREDGYTPYQIRMKLGKHADPRQAELFYWQECEWLRTHEGEVTA